MNDTLVKNMPGVMLYRRRQSQRRLPYSRLLRFLSPGTFAAFGVSLSLACGVFYQAVSLYTAPEPYSVKNSFQNIRQVISKLDQDSFVQRLSSFEKYELAQKVQFVASIINKDKTNADRNQLAVTIVAESLKANIDPLLVTAIVKSESLFKSGAISNKGARGLMQLMPDTAKFAEKNLQKILWRQPGSDIHASDYNLSLGITYLKHLEDSFYGDRELALIAYNWGPGNLKSALKNNTHIPESTRTYARKIISNHQKWLGEMKYLAANYPVGINPAPVISTSKTTTADAAAAKLKEVA